MNAENPDGDNLYLAQSLTSTNEITLDSTSDQSMTPVNLWDEPIYMQELNEFLSSIVVSPILELDEDYVVITGSTSASSVDQPVM
jgi:hypothetical protein